MHSHVSLPSDLVFRLKIKLFLNISDISGITNDSMNEPDHQCCALERRNCPCRSFFFPLLVLCMDRVSGARNWGFGSLLWNEAWRILYATMNTGMLWFRDSNNSIADMKLVQKIHLLHWVIIVAWLTMRFTADKIVAWSLTAVEEVSGINERSAISLALE